MGTEKKSKSGSELPKGSAAPSCKLSALCLPRALLLSGGSPKGVLSSPRAGPCLWVSQGHPITAAAASSGALPRGQGGREGAAARPRGPGERGDPARHALRCGGNPGRGVGSRTKAGGHGDTRWLGSSLSPARLRGLAGLGGSLPWGLAGCTDQGQGVLTVPRRGWERFQGGGWAASPKPCMTAAPLM